MEGTLSKLLLGNGAIALGLYVTTTANWTVVEHVLLHPSNLLKLGFLLLVLAFLSGIVSVVLGAALLGRTTYRTLA